LFVAPGALAGTLYVDVNLVTGLGDGSSWANAYQGSSGLQTALAAAVAGDDIYVAQGRYLASSTNVRTQSFALRNGVEIFGSFAGGESHPGERPDIALAPSILDGDLLGNDASNQFNDNSHHLITTAGTNSTAVIDGFVVMGGNANAGTTNNDRGGGILIVGGASPTIRGCGFYRNRCTFGGGAGYINGSGPRFTDCQFVDNVGGSFGGGFDIAQASNVRFDRCYFEGNTASRAGALEMFASSNIFVTNSVFYNNTATGSGSGGGIWIGSGTSAQIRNCTLVANRATGSASGGGLANSGASPSIVNSIFWGNTAAGGAANSGAQLSPGTPATYSIVQFGAPGAGNLSTDPLFVDVNARNFDLQVTSPAIDAGSNAGIPTGIVGDYLGRRRAVDTPSVPDTGLGAAPLVDIGAYEYTTNIGMAYCGSNPNSVAGFARIDAEGSDAVVDNDVTLVATAMPPNTFGIFVVSRIQGLVLNPGGSTGNLCLGGAIGRFTGPGQILNSGAGGTFQLMLDLNAIPLPSMFVAVQPGETWNFQCWYRDTIFGFQTSNFTDGLAIRFR